MHTVQICICSAKRRSGWLEVYGAARVKVANAEVPEQVQGASVQRPP